MAASAASMKQQFLSYIRSNKKGVTFRNIREEFPTISVKDIVNVLNQLFFNDRLIKVYKNENGDVVFKARRVLPATFNTTYRRYAYYEVKAPLQIDKELKLGCMLSRATLI